MTLCTTLSDKVLDLENVKDAQALEIQKLKKRVKRLEKKRKSRTSQLKRSINLTAAEPVTTVSTPVTTAGVSASTAEPSTLPTTTTTLIEDEDLTISQTLMKMRSVKSKENSKEKGVSSTRLTRGEPKKPVKVKGKDQIALDEEVTQRLEAHMQAEFEEKERVVRKREEEANLISWDNTQAMIGKIMISKKRTKEEFDQESSMRQKTSESSELAKEPRDKEADELSQEELQQIRIIVPVEIWVELKRLFEPDTNDELWKLQKHILALTWKLYDSCRVHHVSTKKGIDIYMLVEKEYPLSRGTLTLMLVAKLLVDQDNEMSRELLKKIFMQAERPRR
nr:hypothetical protein [Tanacetum cinerariifolium]